HCAPTVVGEARSATRLTFLSGRDLRLPEIKWLQATRARFHRPRTGTPCRRAQRGVEDATGVIRRRWAEEVPTTAIGLLESYDGGREDYRPRRRGCGSPQPRRARHRDLKRGRSRAGGDTAHELGPTAQTGLRHRPGALPHRASSETFRCSPAKRTGTTVDFSSSRKGIDDSAGAAI